MERSIQALLKLCQSVAGTDDETAPGFARVLKQVDWSAPRGPCKPNDLPVVEKYLRQAVDLAGDNPLGDLGRAVYADAEHLQWFTMYHAYHDDARLAKLHENYAVVRLAGPRGSWYADDLTVAVTIQGPHTFYPPHAHRAEEIYGVIGGTAEWQRGAEPWRVRPVGDRVWHPGGIRHAIRTRDEPLMAFASWLDHVTDTPAFVWD